MCKEAANWTRPYPRRQHLAEPVQAHQPAGTHPRNHDRHRYASAPAWSSRHRERPHRGSAADARHAAPDQGARVALAMDDFGTAIVAFDAAGVPLDKLKIARASSTRSARGSRRQSSSPRCSALAAASTIPVLAEGARTSAARVLDSEACAQAQGTSTASRSPLADSSISSMAQDDRGRPGEGDFGRRPTPSSPSQASAPASRADAPQSPIWWRNQVA